MAPTRSKKRKSTESTNSSAEMSNFPAPPQMIPTKSQSPMRTPTHRSPAKKARTGITMGQKQALMDNLQLEITERARKLRAQYMLQAQGLRTRIEIRVNRIPMALRTAKMGDLYAKYSEIAVKNTQKSPQRIEKAASPYKNRMEDIRENSRASPSPQKPKKRVSDEMSIDKENEDIENPKKRVRGGPAPPQRVASRSQIQPSQVLSPRSANSRTLPRSPIRQAVPMKSGLARPVSPLKPTAPVPSGGAAGILTNMVEKAKATRGAGARKAAEPKTTTTAAGRAKRTAAPPPPVMRTARGRASTISDSSEGSNTTVVRKPVAAKKEPVKRTVMGTLRGMGGATKKAAAAKPAAAAATGTRVLRKRN
ncbi:hypothetical protein GLAREA_05752 [Glarea lozoyensis ATCC 20868]|uniref:Borealin N-terminal domain-containing protein n=1 Tax=Glarea lozoyensis (strain ATCC 20868 / MF5171) TaxID=1116229 RepID=S3DGZ9_GLAL2|nr:uncharacterized protein GLAREA_05752 [Glarea lozoyensis ATCC 20868]EPE36414.1 hypothetical protein GLAREA_05752 [Glarea lozoyensis ATCC 20868]